MCSERTKKADSIREKPSATRFLSVRVSQFKCAEKSAWENDQFRTKQARSAHFKKKKQSRKWGFFFLFLRLPFLLPLPFHELKKKCKLCRHKNWKRKTNGLKSNRECMSGIMHNVVQSRRKITKKATQQRNTMAREEKFQNKTFEPIQSDELKNLLFKMNGEKAFNSFRIHEQNKNSSDLWNKTKTIHSTSFLLFFYSFA